MPPNSLIMNNYTEDEDQDQAPPSPPSPSPADLAQGVASVNAAANDTPSIPDLGGALVKQALESTPGESDSDPSFHNAVMGDVLDLAKNSDGDNTAQPATRSMASTSSSGSDSDDDNSSDKAAPLSDSDLVRQMLMQKYGIGNGTADLQAAQLQRQQGVANANLGQAFATIANGLAGGKAPLNNNYWNNMREAANLPVTNLLEQRKLAEQGLQNEGQINQLANQMISSDPNAPINKGFQQYLKTVLPPSFKNVDMSGITVATGGPLFTQLSDSYMHAQAELKARELQIQNENMWKQAMLTDKQNARETGYAQTAQHQLNTATKNLDSDQEMINKAQAVVNLAATGNGQAVQDIYAVMSPLLTGSKRLSPEWVNQMGGSKKVTDKVAQVMDQLGAGKLDPANVGYVTQMLGDLQNQNNAQRAFYQKRAAGQLSNLTGQSLGQAASRLGVTAPPPSPQSAKPQTVRQNGHTYTLNPITGQYE